MGSLFCPTSKNSKSIFKPIRKFSRKCVNMDFVIWSELHMCQFSGRLEQLFFQPKPPIFGKKVDFFPLSEKKLEFFPNFNKFILSQLQLKKKKKKIREPFFSRPPNFRDKSGFFSNWKNRNPECFK